MPDPGHLLQLALVAPDHLLHLALIAANPLQTIFGPLVDLMRHVLRFFQDLTGSWGWAIILLTVVVRLFMMPLTFRQFRSAQAMQQLQPKIKELQRKYKNDKRKLQEETMKLYQEYRVNPFSSCLPLVIQMPIFICLYYAIRGTPEIKTASFLFIPSLGEPWLPLFIFYIITQMVSTELMMQPETEAQQKWIMRAMPIFFIFILYRFPAGLMLYWVTTNLWTIGQQLIIRRTAPKRELQPAEAGAKKPSRFMQALLAAQDQQTQKTGARDGAGTGAGKPGASKPGASKSGGAKQGQRRPGGSRPPGKASGKGGTGKRPNRPSGASDGRKRKPTS